MSINIRAIELNDLESAQREISKIKGDRIGIKGLSEKAIFKTIKIAGVNSRIANVIKQEALSVGADAVISNEVFMFRVIESDVLIMGTIKQYEKMYYRMKTHFMDLKDIAESIRGTILKHMSEYESVKIGNKEFDFGCKKYVMGVLNLSPTSFSGDGCKNIDEAIKRAYKIKEDGADIIDIGAESTKPNSVYKDAEGKISVDEELSRIMPVLEKIKKEIDIIVSIDTYKSQVAKETLSAGAHIINDITGLRGDANMAEVISDFDAYTIIMHMQGNPENMQDNPMYNDVIEDIIRELKNSIKIATLAGITSKKIIVDPGIGFGKKLEHNIEILKKLSELKSLGYPILIGASKKSFIKDMLDLDVSQRKIPSIVAAGMAATKGASILRVHDVFETKKALELVMKIN